MNLLELFLNGAARDPAKTAIIDDGATLSFRNLVRAARGLASVVAKATDRDAVGVFLPTCKEFVISYLASLMTGRTTLPLNILLSGEDLEFVAKDAGLDTVVTSRRFLKIIDREDAIRRAVPNVLCLEDIAGTTWKRVKLLARGVFYKPCIAGEDELATLLYTSGTTGRPKGVCLTHRNIVSNIEAAVGASGYTADDVTVQVLPLFHTFALTVTMGAPLANGGTSVAMKRFAPDAVLEAIERHRVSYLVAIPSMFRVLNRAQASKPRDVKCLKCAIAGGEPLPSEVRERFEELFGIELLEGYGLTETSPVVSINPPGENRPGSVGKPLSGVKVRIVGRDGHDGHDGHDGDDGEAREPLGAGAIGELQVRGPTVMAGYHNRPAETAAVLSPDGWFSTGDMARVDPDGYIWITGRLKEMMICGGENVFPAEIEDCLSRHPAVADVGVVGVKDPRRGECPKAFVVLAEGAGATAGELLRFARERLPVFKVPREIVFRDELPKAPTGKVMRRLLREETGKPSARDAARQESMKI